MSKKHILILAAAGLGSFVLTFAVTWVLKRRNVEIPPAPQPAGATQPAGSTAADPSSPAVPLTDSKPRANVAGGLGELELSGLIEDVRQTMQDYEFRQADLTEQSQRLAAARQVLQEDIDRLTKLNAQLAVTLDALRRQEQQLKDTRVKVAQEEKANLQRLAAAYDKMDSTQAAKIIANMMTNRQTLDAVKIVYYMSERTAANLIGELAGIQPELATTLSLELKKIKESE